MRSAALMFVAALLACATFALAQEKEGPTVMLLTDSNGYVHGVVKPTDPTDGESLVARTMRYLVEERLNGTLKHTDDAATLGDDDFDPQKTQVLVMYTTGDVPLDLEKFNRFIENGGALLGIHCATDTLMSTPAFYETIGGVFDGHPWNANTPVVLKGHDLEHAAVEPVGGRRALREEIYQHKHFNPENVRLLISLDMERTELKKPHLVPVAWAKQVGEGRVFYTSLGHREDVWRADWYQDHLTNALSWCIGEARGSAEPNPQVSRREETLAKQAFANQSRQQGAQGNGAQGNAGGSQQQVSATASAREAPATTQASGEASVTLFDGTRESLQQNWRGFGKQEVPEGWVVEDGAIKLAQGGAGDLVTREQFKDFELRFEWKAAERANSGVMYRVADTTAGKGPDAEPEPGTNTTYMTGPEYQVLDDKRHPDARNGNDRKAGSLYGLYAPSDLSAVNPAEEWNEARIVVNGNHVEHWLNGQKVVEAELGSDDWNQRIAASKFRQWARFAREPQGHIALQDHGDTVWFRNIRIKRLEGEDGQ